MGIHIKAYFLYIPFLHMHMYVCCEFSLWTIEWVVFLCIFERKVYENEENNLFPLKNFLHFISFYSFCSKHWITCLHKFICINDYIFHFSCWQRSQQNVEIHFLFKFLLKCSQCWNYCLIFSATIFHFS